MFGYNASFGENVREERTSWGMSQERLAQLCNCSVRTIQHIESSSRMASVVLGALIAEHLGCTLDYLLRSRSA